MILWEIQSALNIQLNMNKSLFWSWICLILWLRCMQQQLQRGIKLQKFTLGFKLWEKTTHTKISALTKSPVPLIDWKWVSSDERYTDCESGLCGFKTMYQNYLNACPCVPLMSVAKDSVNMIAHWFLALIQIIKTHELELSGRRRY